MPPITRKGDKSTGHDLCPAVEAVSGESRFLVNGRPVVTVGDAYAPHGCEAHGVHQGTLAGGSPAFLVNGRQVGRVGDPISCGGTVAEGAGNFIVGNGNEQKGNEALCKRNEAVTRYTRSRDDDIFYCLPLIAEAVGNRQNERDRQGWHYLRDMFYKWLAGEANDKPQNNPSPFWVDIDWVLSYPKALEKWNEAVQERITNEKAIEQIKQYLHELGYIAEKRTEFDFINIPFSDWNTYYYQYESVEFAPFEMAECFDARNGLFACLANFTFRFLAKGKIIYQENDFSVQIEQAAGFVYDIFNFDGIQFLGSWSCAEKNITRNLIELREEYYQLHNSSFRVFRDKYNIGNDFIVLSNQKLIDIMSKN